VTGVVIYFIVCFVFYAEKASLHNVMNSTRILINPDIPEVVSLRKRWSWILLILFLSFFFYNGFLMLIFPVNRMLELALENPLVLYLFLELGQWQLWRMISLTCFQRSLLISWRIGVWLSFCCGCCYRWVGWWKRVVVFCV